jgi:hypothetical protein
LLIEALKGIGVADNNLLGAHIKAGCAEAVGMPLFRIVS